MTPHTRPHRQGTIAMATRRRSDRWFDRIGNEVYVGAMVVGLVVVVVGVVALLIQTVFGISRWVQLGD